MDITGPFDVFRRANEVTESEYYDLRVVGARHRSVETFSGLGFMAQASLDEAACEGLPHTLVVSGGNPDVPAGSDDAYLANWLREQSSRIHQVCSVCSGAFLLGEAGLLDGRRATTHWSLLALLQQRFPKVSVVDDVLFVGDDKVWTSAGVTSGIDMALAMVERDLGYQVSLAVARFLVLFLRRSGNQRQFSAPLAGQRTERRNLRELQVYIASHLNDDLTIDRLASVCKMSPRNLSRVFKNELGLGLGEFVRAVRLDEARRLLESTDLGVSQIAVKVGSGDESTLRRWFADRYGVSPTQYRERFQASSLWMPSPQRGGESQVAD
ncbi:HTH-type transcriptional regulator CdhR [Aeoliella mucimassa]|uniref:HTH-type transcriptional regulator CdhR n=1 Tax=Aeoliella mucimassa TaxID=2527972 RepID=A0A518AVW4_9BACT|nr:HTH-type transcriptional regulator CdhR [Aeoliella mucimassa]